MGGGVNPKISTKEVAPGGCPTHLRMATTEEGPIGGHSADAQNHALISLEHQNVQDLAATQLPAVAEQSFLAQPAAPESVGARLQCKLRWVSGSRHGPCPARRELNMQVIRRT